MVMPAVEMKIDLARRVDYTVTCISLGHSCQALGLSVEVGNPLYYSYYIDSSSSR